MLYKNFMILSCADSKRFGADINHQRYADNLSVEYQFRTVTHLRNPFFIKPYCISESLSQGYENILCIDDDAFFINQAWDFREIFSNYCQDLIVTQGRQKKSGTTLFNAGVMFIKNTERMQLLFSKICDISLKELKKNWKKQWGPLEGNEQPRLIYLTQKLFPESTKILDYPGFNAHEITFKQRKNFLATNPPIVHITGQNKEGKIKRFQEVTGISLP
jgi:hypothetical protein